MPASRSASRRSFSPAALMGALFFLLWGSACGEEQLQEASCQYTYECDYGQLCVAGICVSSADASRDVGGAGGQGQGGEEGSGGAGGQGGEAGGGGAGGEQGEEPAPERVAFAPDDYRRCFDSLECAVFGGDCLVELPLSRPLPDGRDRVRLSDIDPSLREGEGICGTPCTNEARLCEALTVEGPKGKKHAFTCQLIYAGESPYPEGEILPFSADLLAMARGVPFASICRPPFASAPAHSPDFCAPCMEAAHCSEGDACWLDRPYVAEPSGACVQPCELQRDCPFGFRCTDVSEGDHLLLGEAGSYCLAVEGTCGPCLDRDGDQRGVGNCGPPEQPITAVDCDDSNPQAYFDPTRPNHPFPAVCGEVDFNCNGIPDDLEQLGSSAHCAFCGDPCGGPVPNGVRRCVEAEDGSFSCVALCDEGYADCNGLLEDGCEAELEESMIWARDRDGDGRGDPNELAYFCDVAVPPGWVQNTYDCDDDDPSVYGGGGVLAPALEVCDGLDNDCNGLIDDGEVVALDASGQVIAVAGEPCDTGFEGVCAEGAYVCEATVRPALGDALAAMRCAPRIDPDDAWLLPELCNGLDDNCDGQVDEDVDWYEEQGQSNPEGRGAPAQCQVPGGKGICAWGTWTCLGAAGWVCEPNQPKASDPIGDGVDENCDGIDGDMGNSIFVRPKLGGGFLGGNDANDGQAQRPVASISRALELACAGVPAGESCRDIYLDAEIFESNQAIAIPTSSTPGELPFVRIYGGFSTRVDCDEQSCELEWLRDENARSALRRIAPAAGPGQNPLGVRYAALQGSGGAPMELLLDRVDLLVEAPAFSALTGAGASAPSQIGIECPQQGCSRLELRDVEIVVESALAGAEGAAGALGALPPNGNDGLNGCSNIADCAPGVTGGGGKNFMHYGYCRENAPPLRAVQELQKQAALCADGSRPNGGMAGGHTCAIKDFVYDAYYRGRKGHPGGGNPPGEGSGSRGGRGRDGILGQGGSYRGTAGWSYEGGPKSALRYEAALGGRSGSGGGGGGSAEIQRISLFGNEIYISKHLGGSGGAGGCNGGAGGRGGDGGSAIGLVLIPPASGELSFVLHGEFALRVGAGGDGGKGGDGGDGAPGGWGGSGNPNSERRQNGVPSFYGGAGGDGGGGGGGGGGHGGLSVGIWAACTRGGAQSPETCGIRLPVKVRAAPELLIFSEEPGQGGEGGEGGRRGEKAPHPHQRVDEQASPGVAGSGAAGLAGSKHHIFFTGGAQ